MDFVDLSLYFLHTVLSVGWNCVFFLYRIQANSLLLKFCAEIWSPVLGTGVFPPVQKGVTSWHWVIESNVWGIWVTESEIIYKEVKCLFRCQNTLEFFSLHVVLSHLSCFWYVFLSFLLYETQKYPEEGLCIVFCNEANWTWIYCCPSKFMRSLSQLYRKKLLV